MFFGWFKRKNKTKLQQTERWHFPLTEFIEVLKTEKFSVGVDTHILMHKVIRQFDLPGQLHELAEYLAPIVAQSAEEQEKFCEYFNRWFFIENLQVYEDEITPRKQEKSTQRHKDREKKQDNKKEKLRKQEQEDIEQTENKRAVLNIERGMLPKQGLSFSVLPVKVDFPPDILRKFRLWRYMSETDRVFFDIEATVKLITKKGEIAEPVYKHKRKHNEYLIIVEQNTYKNHYANFIKTIYKTLLKNNIDVRLFTFNTDPRILYAANNGKKYSVNQVFSLYGNAVLLYFGSPALWFDTQYFKIYKWTKIFTRWQQRFWFPDKSPDKWHLPEKTGLKIFPNILPLDLKSFEVITKYITENASPDLLSARYWTQNINYELTDINTKLPLDTIALFFSPLMRAWIAACAVYPEMNWELTLNLGKYISPKDYNLCSAANILQLLRLDWFRNGYMPPQIRFALITAWLPDDMMQRINAYIVELMQNDTKFDFLKKMPAFRMQLAVHKLMAETDAEERKKLAEDLAKEVEQSGTADFVALQYINEAELSPVFFAIPDELIELFEKALGKPLKTKTSQTKVSKNYTEKIGDVSFDMIFVEGGTFKMGSKEYSDEKPHDVTVSGFYIGKFPVTQKLWKAVMGNNPSRFKGCDDCPVENVSWYDAVEFCNRLSEKAGLEPYYNIDKNTKDPNNKSEYDDLKWTVTINKNANGYRLPTEAEWEYAARGGQKSKGYKYAGSNNIDEVAWYTKTTNDKGTKPVGTKKHNELEIYDMSGNVWEWCWDWYDSDYYKNSPQNNPQGPSSGSYRVLRGGGWNGYADTCRVASRNRDDAYDRDNHGGIGFRVARGS